MDPTDIRRLLSGAFIRPIKRIAYERTPLGIVPRSLYGGDDETHPLWSVGQQIGFPYISAASVRRVRFSPSRRTALVQGPSSSLEAATGSQ